MRLGGRMARRPQRRGQLYCKGSLEFHEEVPSGSATGRPVSRFGYAVHWRYSVTDAVGAAIEAFFLGTAQRAELLLMFLFYLIDLARHGNLIEIVDLLGVCVSEVLLGHVSAVMSGPVWTILSNVRLLSCASGPQAPEHRRNSIAGAKSGPVKLIYRESWVGANDRSAVARWSRTDRCVLTQWSTGI